MPDSRDFSEALAAELEYLWDDLNTARMNALNGQWSIQCDNLADRIKTLTQLVGPTPWEKIQLRLLDSGVYQRVHDELGIEVSPDMDRVRELLAKISEG